jgi:3-hydroxybutyryl-CoA dehydrogenase
MARSLLVGPAELVAEFAGIVDASHEVVALVDRSITLPPNVHAVESLIDIDEPMDLAIDLSIDEPSAALARLATRRDALGHGGIVVVNGLTMTATAASRALGMPGVVATSVLCGVTARAAHLELASALQCDGRVAESAAGLLGELTGRPIERVEDRIGLVSARVLAMVINEAAFAVMESVATPHDIDVAMKLGTNYPNGPLAWADAIGHETVVRILDALYDEYREERYRASVLLRQHARAGLAFTAS